MGRYGTADGGPWSERGRKIEVHDVGANRVSTFATKRVVRFPVDPPVHRTQDGTPVRLRPEEGVIDVIVEDDGSLTIRGRHGLLIIPESGNAVRVRLR